MTDLPQVDAARIPVSATYHGVEVTEYYRWLEDPSSPETTAWTKAQRQRTRAYFDQVEWRSKLRDRVAELLQADTTEYRHLVSGGDAFFAMKSQSTRQRPFLVQVKDLDDLTTEKTIVDPVERDPSGETTIDFFVPSPDGSKVAVSLSEHGTEDGTLHVFETDTKEEVTDPIPHASLMGGSVAWRHDSAGFWYSLPADPDGFHHQVWFRALKEKEPDRLDLAGGFAEERIAEHFLSSSPDGRWVMDRVQRGDSDEWQIFLRSQDAAAQWWQAAALTDKCVHAVFGPDGLYLIERKTSPNGRLLRMTVTQHATVNDAREVVPAGARILEDAAVTNETIWVVDADGGPQRLSAFDHDGNPLPAPDLPPVSSVSSFFARMPVLGPDRIAWSLESFTEPAVWWLAVDGEKPRKTALATRTPVDLSGYQVTREFATSHDGTKIPMTVIAAPGTPRDGTAPALLYGYGGYGLSLVPDFDPRRLPWLEQGGVYVVANLRGGGEYGEPWHHAARLTTKQNAFDDFIACADHLVETNLTTRAKLAIMGGSNGGLLIGAVLTQRPDLARAVVAQVPVLDSLRAEITTNGQFNVPEFGTVADPAQFAALLAYSPYHNVNDGTKYPAVLLTAGEHDSRVDAWHAKKMTARLQHATASGAPVLLRLESTGHLAGSRGQAISEVTDRYAFLFTEMSLGYRPPAP